MPKPILVSGIQPSGRLHIGNYLGALKNFVDLQNSGKYDCYFFLADLHSLTEFPENAAEEKKRISELVADFLAAGLDPKKSTLYQQSQIPAHSELAWIFNTITPMGELGRMTQFKEKGGIQRIVSGGGGSNIGRIYNLPTENVNVGLFNYPVLMAADILMYNPKFVPVGHDQLQHLELTRTIARKFNGKFGKTFIEPQPLLTKTPRVMSLDDPSKKMSKSRPAGCLFLDDSPEEIKKKIMRATTDSGSEIKYDPEQKPGISNLLLIAAGLRDEDVGVVENKFKNKTYAEFKSTLAGLISDHFADFRKKKAVLAKKNVLKMLEPGTKKAAKSAEKKIKEVKKKVGLLLN